MLLLDAEHAVPDIDAVAGPHVAVILAVDGDAEAVNAGQAPVRTAGPVVRPRKARVRDQAAEARPARAYSRSRYSGFRSPMPFEKMMIASALASRRYCSGRSLQPTSSQRRAHALLADEAFGCFFRNVEFYPVVHWLTPSYDSSVVTCCARHSGNRGSLFARRECRLRRVQPPAAIHPRRIRPRRAASFVSPHALRRAIRSVPPHAPFSCPAALSGRRSAQRPAWHRSAMRIRRRTFLPSRRSRRGTNRHAYPDPGERARALPPRSCL